MFLSIPLGLFTIPLQTAFGQCSVDFGEMLIGSLACSAKRGRDELLNIHV